MLFCLLLISIMFLGTGFTVYTVWLLAVEEILKGTIEFAGFSFMSNCCEFVGYYDEFFFVTYSCFWNF